MVRLPIALLTVLAAACAATPGESSSSATIDVEVACGEEFVIGGECPSGDLRLEIGDLAWQVADGGAATVESASEERVRLLDATGCTVFVEFVADPGHEYFVQLAQDGHATAVDRAHQPVSTTGRSDLEPSSVSGCD
jgi:hypothetical protein